MRPENNQTMVNMIYSATKDGLGSDMEKGADARTLSAEVFENCGNFWIVEEYLLLLLRETI